MAQVAAYALDEGTGLTAADASGGGHILTLTNATWTASGHTNAALTNTAADTGALATVPAITTAVTLMCWVKPLDLAAGSTHMAAGIFQAGGSTDIALFTQRGSFGTANVLQADIRIGGGLVACNGTSALTVGTWAHVAVTFDGANIKLYRNGVLETTVANTGAISLGTAFYVAGALATASVDSDVVVDDVRLYDTALDVTTIATLRDTPVGGAAAVNGSGVVTAASASVTGAGAVVVAGSGSAAALGAAVLGAGAVVVSGAGGAAATSVTGAGAGAVLVSGGGAVSATSASAAGGAVALVTGSGVLVVTNAVTLGTGSEGDSPVDGIGDAIAPRALAGGTGTVTGGGALFRPNSHLVAMAWLRTIPALAGIVAAELPKSGDWSGTGFVTVPGIVGGTPGIYLPERNPVVSVHAWATRSPTSKRLPRGMAATLLEEAVAACYQPVPVLELPAQYKPVWIEYVKVILEPGPAPEPDTNFAHYVMDLQIGWIERDGT